MIGDLDRADAQLLDHRLAVAAGRLAGGLVRHGDGQHVFRAQRRAARVVTTLESMPPDSPTTARWNPARPISVRMNRVRMA